jgi:aryl-alcohol dehydrogenase-like predicted oxidoreductase
VTKPAHLEGALKALDLTLDAETITALEEPYVPHEKLSM